ncbi:MAG TPA: hypothetical protein VGX97_06415 [bacterium]|nr:hypothetical protein [bacterium]
MQHPYEPFDQRFAGIEAGVARLEGRVEQGFADMRDRFGSIDQRFGSIDQRLSSIDQRLSSIDQRFSSIDGCFDSVDRRFESLEQKMDRHFFWILGLLLISVLLPVAAHFSGH